MKICSKCNIEKLLNQFNKNKTKSDGYHVWCKQCISINNKKLYIIDSKRIKQQTNDYYHNNKDIISPKLKEYRNKLEIKLKQKQYIKEWVKNNKTHYRQYQNNYVKQRRNNDPYFKTIENLKSQIYIYLKNKTKNNKTEILLGYKYVDFINKIGIIKDNLEIDHKIPISWFKNETPIDIIWNLNNLQLTTQEYNRKKSNTYSDVVYVNYYKIVYKWIKKSRLSMISTYL
jgi:hypothetical protein